MEIKYFVPGREDASRYWEMLDCLDHETEFMMYEPGERTRDLDRIERMIDSAQSNPSDALLLAVEADGHLAGFISASRGNHRRTAHSAYIVVGIRAAWRGMGIGTELFRRLDLWARDNGLTRLELTVLCENSVALKLYQKSGFQIEGTRRRSMRVNGVFKDEYDMAKLYPEEDL